jgi:hypothetical protein
MSSIKYFLITLFLCLITETSVIFAQDADNNTKIKALNNYVNFSNESTHGMLIVHRLLENFNKSINKFVDLPDQKINFYSNKDLPVDIFEDPEDWFYETSPNEWYNKINQSKSQLPSSVENKLSGPAGKMKSNIASINKIRFDLEDMIQKLDLTKRENLSLVYDKLEEAVTFYKDYYTQQQILETEVSTYYKTLQITENDIQFPAVVKTVDDLYIATRTALHALYIKEDENFGDLIKKQQLALSKFSAIQLTDYNSTRLINPKMQTYWNNIIKQSKESIAAQQLFVESENIPEEFKIYNKFYYYYNISVINKFNRYGNGVVFEMNRIIDYLSIPKIRYFEMPHYFKVIYPKILEKTEFLAASDPVIKALPKTVKGRSVITATRTINVDSFIVDLQMYDHKIVDRDVVSLSFNGDWIVEKYSITEKPYDFTLKLNEEGKNFLLLHADDMGRQPPATIALSYKYKGKKQLIILNSDTVKSEVIEIVVK